LLNASRIENVERGIFVHEVMKNAVLMAAGAVDGCPMELVMKKSRILPN